MTNDDTTGADAGKTPETQAGPEDVKRVEERGHERHRHGPHEHERHGRRKRGLGGKFALAGAALALLAVGGGVGATAVNHMRPAAQMAPLAPVTVAAMKDDSIVTLKGKVAEIYGNKFVLADESGRALIETGRAGEGGKLVNADENLTVQGRFDDGFVKAAFLVRADGKTEAIGGFGPKHGPHERGPKHGPRDDGPDRRGPAGDDGPKEPGKL